MSKWFRSSAFKSYEWCPRKYWLTYELGFEDKAGPSALVGTIAHWVLEILAKMSLLNHDPHSKLWNPMVLWDIAEAHYSSKQPEIWTRVPKSKITHAKAGILNILETHESPISNNIKYIEKYFELPFGSDIIKGTIDRIDIDDSGLWHMIDYKTGQKKDFVTQEEITPSYLEKSIQPQIYFWACSQMFPDVEAWAITFYYLMDGGPVTIVMDKSNLPEIEKNIWSKISAIQNDNHFNKHEDWRCNKVCHFGRQGICQEVTEEIAELGIGFTKTKYDILNDKAEYGRS